MVDSCLFSLDDFFGKGTFIVFIIFEVSFIDFKRTVTCEWETLIVGPSGIDASTIRCSYFILKDLIMSTAGATLIIINIELLVRPIGDECGGGHVYSLTLEVTL